MKSTQLIALMFVFTLGIFTITATAQEANQGQIVSRIIVEETRMRDNSTNYCLTNLVDFKVRVIFTITGVGYNRSEGTKTLERTLGRREKMVYISNSSIHTRPNIVHAHVVE